MAVFRTKYERINFDFDPPLRQTADVVFEVDAEEYTEDNYNLFDSAAGTACGLQNPHWFEDYSAPLAGYAGWSSVLSCGKGYTKVEDNDFPNDDSYGIPKAIEKPTRDLIALKGWYATHQSDDGAVMMAEAVLELFVGIDAYVNSF